MHHIVFINIIVAIAFAMAILMTTTIRVAITIFIANVIAIGIGKATIKYPNEGAQLPNAAMFGGMSHAALLATTSFGHILGMGAILGLAARGVV